MQYVKSFCVMGPDGTGRSQFATSLGKINNLSVVRLKDFEFLPTLSDLETWKKEPTKRPSNITSNEVDRLLNIRKAYPKLKNLHELGYDMNIEAELLKEFGIPAADFYKKQFENILLEDLMNSIEGDVVLELNASTPVNFDNEFNALLEQIKSRPEAEKLNKYFPHKDYIGTKVTDKLLNSFRNRVYLPLPKNESNYSHTAMQKKETNKHLVKSGDYEKYATITIMTDDFHTENKNLDHAQVERGAEIARNTAQKSFDQRPENPPKKSKKEEKKDKKPSLFRRLFNGLLWLFPITWVVKGIQRLRVSKMIKDLNNENSGKTLKATVLPAVEKSDQEKSTTEPESTNDVTQEKDTDGKTDPQDESEKSDEKGDETPEQDDGKQSDDESGKSDEEDEKDKTGDEETSGKKGTGTKKMKTETEEELGMGR